MEIGQSVDDTRRRGVDDSHRVTAFRLSNNDIWQYERFSGDFKQSETTMSQQFRKRRASGIDQRDECTETNRTCGECGTGSLRRTADETAVFCENCGLVVAEAKVTLEPRRQRARTAERRQSAIDAPLTRRYDDGLMTAIDRQDVDVHGTALTPRKRRRMRRLRHWQERFRLMDGDTRQFALEIRRLSVATRRCRSAVVTSR